VTRIRLLPIVLFGVTALLCLKLVGLVAGVGSFAVGPDAATAAGAGHGEAPAAAPPAPVNFPGPLVDLAAEAEALKKKQEAGGHGDAPADGEATAEAGHGEAPADGQGEAPADGQGEAPADHGGETAVTGDLPEEPVDGQATDLPGETRSAEADAPATDGHGGTPAAEGETGATDAAAAGGEHGAPAEASHGGGEGEGEGEGAPAVTTVRPKEYVPPDASSEALVLESLAERREALEAREADLADREKLLEAAEQRLQARIDELKSLENQLGGAPSELAAEDEEKVKGLVAMYEAMKPKAAARVFDTLDMGVLISVARAMSPRRMSAIMAVMDPERAALLTTALAGNQSPREVIVRRPDAEFAAPGGSPASTDPEDLPKIMPAPGTEPPPG
jgi:flagellar motility protein MotE (MotC chaperone)